MAVRARSAKKPSPIRYLLLADQKLQRISLKKISARLKKAKRQSRSKSAANGSSAQRLRTPGSAATAMLLVGGCVVGAAALITARQPSAPADAARQPASIELIEQETRTRPVSPLAGAKKPAASKAPTSAVAVKTPAMERTPAKMPAEAPKLPTVSNVEALAPVTITGCLEMARGSFRLKDASGADAPKSRSWKSGFLRKRSSQIELVDDVNALRLPTYVGQRVVATGTLANGEMRARSLKRVAASCE